MTNRLLVLLYTIYASLVFLVFMFLYSPLIIIPLAFKLNGNRLSYYGLHIWARSFRLFSGIRYQVKGREHLRAEQSYIFTPNHTSFLDIPALPLIAHHAFKPLAKKEVAHIPLFGPVAKAVTIMVDRSNPAHRRQSVTKLTKALQAGTNIVVFPEGTINKTDRPLTSFYDGAFRIAIETQTPVVPVVITGASRLMPPRSWFMKPGLITVKILAPVEASGLTMEDLPALKEQVYRNMEKQLPGLQESSARRIKKGTAEAMPF